MLLPNSCYDVFSRGTMKLLGEGGTPKLLVIKGELKSSISLFSIIPVEFDINLEPKLGEEKEYDVINKYYY